MTMNAGASSVPRTISRRTVWSGLTGVGVAAALAACGSGDDSGGETSPSGSASKAPARRTPVAHPAGLSYGPWLRPSSHLLDAGGTKAVLVEFLDFECEACAGVFPVIEQVRGEFTGKLTYAIRYFPLNGHPNSRPAAYAVEAAARQGKLEPMYKLMFQNQQEWGERGGSADAPFRRFATEAGLNVPKWETDRASAPVKARVDLDLKDTTALGLQSTPSFFFNGKPFRPSSPDELRATIRDAVR